jgi:hypothetical protein
MRPSLFGLNLAVLSVLTTVVVMQQRGNARPAMRLGGPIAGNLESEIPVERKFSVSVLDSMMAQAPATSGWIAGSVSYAEFVVPANLGIVVTNVSTYKVVSGSETICAYAVVVNGQLKYIGPDALAQNGGVALGAKARPYFVPPGSTLRFEMANGQALNVQFEVLNASEITFP